MLMSTCYRRKQARSTACRECRRVVAVRVHGALGHPAGPGSFRAKVAAERVEVPEEERTVFLADLGAADRDLAARTTYRLIRRDRADAHRLR